jgi:hypothetical protein
VLKQHLAAAVILQDRMRRSARNLIGENFIMIDDMCGQVAPRSASRWMLSGKRCWMPSRWQRPTAMMRPPG